MDEEIETTECPWCHAIQDPGQAYLGELGDHHHYRCRYCGGHFVTKEEGIDNVNTEE